MKTQTFKRNLLSKLVDFTTAIPRDVSDITTVKASVGEFGIKLQSSWEKKDTS